MAPTRPVFPVFPVFGKNPENVLYFPVFGLFVLYCPVFRI